MSGSGAATQVVLRVQDDGTGMSDHVRRHAFDPFFTTRLGQGGSGLGLSVSHQLAKVTLGGNLSVESSPGSGSCFTFCFLQNLS
jgi:signal transduction histidine kinase